MQGHAGVDWKAHETWNLDCSMAVCAYRRLMLIWRGSWLAVSSNLDSVCGTGLRVKPNYCGLVASHDDLAG